LHAGVLLARAPEVQRPLLDDFAIGRFWLTSALENVGLKSTASSTSIFSTSPVASSTMKA
jgi:hypothetical protein